jgi:lysine-arginine-ornithine-binding protein
MPLIAILSVFVALFSLSANAADKRKVVLGTEGAYAPFNFTDDKGQLAGFDIEIGNALCEAMNAECTWVTSDWDGIIPALLAKKFDAILASMSITEDRKKKIDFTSKYYTSPVSFVVDKNSAVALFASGLKGKAIGVQSGTVTENLVNGLFGKIADVKAYKTQEEANLDFLSGRVDLVAADSFVVDEFLATEDGKGATLFGSSIDDTKYLGEGIGIGVRKGDDDLKKALNDAIAKIRADGTYQKINDKYFKFDVYGS